MLTMQEPYTVRFLRSKPSGCKRRMRKGDEVRHPTSRRPYTVPLHSSFTLQGGEEIRDGRICLDISMDLPNVGGKKRDKSSHGSYGSPLRKPTLVLVP